MSNYDICYIISNGFAARMILHTNVIGELKKSGLGKIAVILPVEENSTFKDLESRLGISIYCIDKKYSRVLQEYFSLRKYIYEDINSNPALLSKHLKSKFDYRGYNPWRKVKPNIYFGLHKVVRKMGFLKGLFRGYEKVLLRDKKLRKLLKKIDPKVIISTYPVNYLEGAALQIGNELGITTVTQLSSWDNITCKGRFPSISDYFISWGKIMTDELKEYYNLSGDRIFETGVPHFDKGKELVNESDLKCNIQELGLDPEKPYIFFGMSSPYFAPREIDIVERLSDQINRNIYGENMQLVIRPHPQNVQGEIADKKWLPRLDSLKGERVSINYPVLENSTLPWNVNEKDFQQLVNLIAGCSVVINTGSTLSIEGLIYDKPVIVSLFDADYILKVYNSAQRIRDYFHFKKLIDTGAVSAVYHYEDLKNTMLEYLENPRLKHENREKALKLECGEVDGNSSKRIAESLLKITK